MNAQLKAIFWLAGNRSAAFSYEQIIPVNHYIPLLGWVKPGEGRVMGPRVSWGAACDRMRLELESFFFGKRREMLSAERVEPQHEISGWSLAAYGALVVTQRHIYNYI